MVAGHSLLACLTPVENSLHLKNGVDILSPQSGQNEEMKILSNWELSHILD
jgi:hypothetical protein